jgi:hypothetical protein
MDLINKKGITSQIMTLYIMGIVLVVLVMFIYLWALAGPLFVGLMGDANTEFKTLFQQTNDQHLINASVPSIETGIDSLNTFEWVSYMIFIFMFLGFLIMCFYVRTYPFLIAVWIVLIIIIVFLSIFLTVTYQDISLDPSVSGYYSQWENTDFMLKNLPAILSVLGVIGGIIMFILATREQEIEQQTGGLSEL